MLLPYPIVGWLIELPLKKISSAFFCASLPGSRSLLLIIFKIFTLFSLINSSDIPFNESISLIVSEIKWILCVVETNLRDI